MVLHLIKCFRYGQKYSSKLFSKEMKISWAFDTSRFMQESLGLNPDCFQKIRLLSKKYFNMLLFNTFTFKNLATDWKKRDWTIFFDVLFVTFFKNQHNVSSFSSIWKYSTFQVIFKYFKKSWYYSVAGSFQHANTDHIMTMSFIRIEFTDFNGVKVQVFSKEIAKKALAPSW